jgi:hypothetical protein
MEGDAAWFGEVLSGEADAGASKLRLVGMLATVASTALVGAQG